MQRVVARRSFAAARCARLYPSRRLSSTTTAAPIIRITNGTFYRQHPATLSSSPSSTPLSQTHDTASSQTNPPLFPDLTLSLPSHATPNQHWAILSPSSTIRTAFLQVLRGQLICIPPTSRSFPHLLSEEITSKNPDLRFPERAIEYVGFDVERKDFGGAYLSARYESRVEETDFTLERYLTGIVGLNPGEEVIREKTPDHEVMQRVVKDLELERFFEKPVSTLSNGQSRRARIGKALLTRPEVLCLDAPFIGLDPFVSQHISKVLHRLAEANSPRIVLSLRPQDVIPEWITHIVYAGEDGKVDALGPKDEVFRYLQEQYQTAERSVPANDGDLDPKLVEIREVGRHLSERGDFEANGIEEDGESSNGTALSRDGYEKFDTTPATIGEPVVQIDGARVKYGSNSVLGDWQQTVDGSPKDGLWWNVHRGQRWGVFGANGSGKTTLLSLVTSDHPQTYSVPIRIFQRSRLPSPGVPGITIFDIQSRMGHASPEVHALFPKRLTIKSTLESAWSDTPITNPKLTPEASARIEASLRWFASELNPNHDDSHPSSSLDWASNSTFGEVSFSAQRVLLFLRATIRNPEIVILDEAFSGMDDLVRDKCLLFLSKGESMALHYSPTGPKPVKSDVESPVVPGLQDHQALLCVSHSRQEVPGCVREWICLPEPGSGEPRFGRFDGPVELSYKRWNEIWNWPEQK
ncbi:ABC transporter-like protein [Aaosphaeria arxii CBS 175.79]|uniref:ABC transporter-like protein n=1 Tax=Aaosphaeria arxii CBS 175.79 TaxID=1450172 RepID=A0A6A5XA98_9PLEO|nr:ABC transporter-like protein [Aaosphaeria arxii CBS 175.79]KAF2009908.1 ABC transporter-like protein [Aaosphaeria arxii CBS 175.79]